MADEQQPPQTPDSSWQFTPDPATTTWADPAQDEASEYQQDVQPITWTASEYIAHHKSSSWYLILAVVAILGAVGVWLLTRDLISAAVIIVGAGVFGSYAGRQPRQLEYQLDLHGLTIGPKQYSFTGFRSFSVIPEGAFSSIVFLPLKRFSPPITIYYAPEDEESIVNLLSVSLPLEDRTHDMVDRFINRIRF